MILLINKVEIGLSDSDAVIQANTVAGFDGGYMMQTEYRKFLETV